MILPLLLLGCDSGSAAIPPLEGGSATDSFSCLVSSITDGDTFRCSDGTRIRLSGVAARETDGTCKPGHPCPDASAEAATAELTRLALGKQLSCQKQNMTYGRIAAFCRTEDGEDLSCAMLAGGTVARWDKYWGDHRCLLDASGEAE